MLLKSSFCLSFFLAITSKNIVYQLSEKTLFLSVFDYLGLRDPHFQEISYFVFVRTVGVFSLLNLENLLISTSIVNNRTCNAALTREQGLLQNF